MLSDVPRYFADLDAGTERAGSCFEPAIAAPAASRTVHHLPNPAAGVGVLGALKPGGRLNNSMLFPRVPCGSLNRNRCEITQRERCEINVWNRRMPSLGRWGTARPRVGACRGRAH